MLKVEVRSCPISVARDVTVSPRSEGHVHVSRFTHCLAEKYHNRQRTVASTFLYRSRNIHLNQHFT